MSQITFASNGVTRMTTTKNWDFLNRLTSVSSTPSASLTQPISFNYAYNSANQRTQDTLNDGSYWLYGYDPVGQVTNGCKSFSDGTPVAGQQFDYTFDTIGNRLQTKAGGDYMGASLRVANYTNNSLNQITGRDVPGYADIMGASILTNTVTVAGQPAYRNQEYFRQQVSVNNSSSSVWTNIVVSGGVSVTGHVYVAQEPEVFTYDLDGNLLSDGRWNYTWDAENRLINSNQAIVAEYEYDPFGNTLSQSGSLADANLYRFSSKEYHPNSGLIYYGYRFYDPNLQRWVNRDPLWEMAVAALREQRKYARIDDFINAYNFVENNALNLFDRDGLIPDGSTPPSYPDGPVRYPPLPPCVKDCSRKCFLATLPMRGACAIGCIAVGPGYLGCLGICNAGASISQALCTAICIAGSQ